MKTTIAALAFLLLLNLKVSGQGMPVYDNTNFLSLGKQLLESAKQTSELLNTVELLKEQKENLELVSSAISQLKAAGEIQRNNRRLFELVQNDLRGILSSPYIKAEEITMISGSFTAILENSVAELEFMGQILSSDLLKMSDAERTAILKVKQAESREMVADVSLKARRYQDIISFRRMQDKINNRETEY